MSNLGPPDHLCPKCGEYVMCDNVDEVVRLRAALEEALGLIVDAHGLIPPGKLYERFSAFRLAFPPGAKGWRPLDETAPRG